MCYRVAFFLICFLAVGSRPVEAGPIKDAFRLGNWSGGAYFDDQTRAFEGCSAKTVNADGAAIAYSVNREFRWSVILSNPKWNFIAGTSRSLGLQIGDARPFADARVIATGRTAFELQTRDPILLFAELRAAQKIRLTIGGLVFGFSLYGGEEVLSDLTQCVLHETRTYRKTKSINSISALHDTVPQQEKHKEAVALASAIIAYAHVANSKMLDPAADFSNFPIDAAWRVGLVTAGLTITKVSFSSEQIADSMTASALRACGNGFFFISLPDKIDEVPIVRLFVSCQTSETTTSTYHLIIPRPKQGHYITTVVGSGSSLIGIAHKAANEYQARLRRVIMQAISNFHHGPKVGDKASRR